MSAGKCQRWSTAAHVADGGVCLQETKGGPQPPAAHAALVLPHEPLHHEVTHREAEALGHEHGLQPSEGRHVIQRARLDELHSHHGEPEREQLPPMPATMGSRAPLAPPMRR